MGIVVRMGGPQLLTSSEFLPQNPGYVALGVFDDERDANSAGEELQGGAMRPLGGALGLGTEGDGASDTDADEQEGLPVAFVIAEVTRLDETKVGG